MANNSSGRPDKRDKDDLWTTCIKPRLAAELGVADPMDPRVDLYDVLNQIITNEEDDTPLVLQVHSSEECKTIPPSPPSPVMRRSSSLVPPIDSVPPSQRVLSRASSRTTTSSLHSGASTPRSRSYVPLHLDAKEAKSPASNPYHDFFVRVPSRHSIEDSDEESENESIAPIQEYGIGLCNTSIGSTLVGCYADSHDRFAGGMQAGCGTHDNRRLAVVTGSSAHGTGMSTPDFYLLDGVGGHCMYFEWDDYKSVKPSLSVLASSSLGAPVAGVEAITDELEEGWAYGVPVTLKKNKIVVATEGDSVLGVTCPPMGVVSNAQELEWHGKYKKSIFGSILTRVSYTAAIIGYLLEDKGTDYNELIHVLTAHDCSNVLDYLTPEQRQLVPLHLISPVHIPVVAKEYEPSRVYVPRRLRPEWVPVCYSGIVRVRKEYIGMLGQKAIKLAEDDNTVTVHL